MWKKFFNLKTFWHWRWKRTQDIISIHIFSQNFHENWRCFYSIFYKIFNFLRVSYVIRTYIRITCTNSITYIPSRNDTNHIYIYLMSKKKGDWIWNTHLTNFPVWGSSVWYCDIRTKYNKWTKYCLLRKLEY